MKKKFKVMKQTILSETEQKYGNELRQNYGDAIMADANKRLSDMSRETWILQETLEKEIRLLLKNAVKQKIPIANKLKRHVICIANGYACFGLKEYTLKQFIKHWATVMYLTVVLNPITTN